jgi:hypothetical protein
VIDAEKVTKKLGENQLMKRNSLEKEVQRALRVS